MNKVARVILKEIAPRSPVFTTAEVAEAADVEVSNASRDLSGLADDGVVTRIRRGLWAVSGHPDFSPYVVVPHLFEQDEAGYVSFFTALSLRGLIDQIPQLVEVATRVHRKTLETPVGTYDFHQIQPDLFGGYEPADRRWSYLLATSEKAIFDAMYISVRKGRQFARFPELDPSDEFSYEAVGSWIEKLDQGPVRRAVEDRWKRVRRSLSTD